MGTFHINCRVENPGRRTRFAVVQKVLVDSGSECTWIPEATLEKIGIEREKKDLTFVMANGQRITRSVGFAIVRVGAAFTIDEVVFAEKGDLLLLGARTLEGLNLRSMLLGSGWWPAGRFRRRVLQGQGQGVARSFVRSRIKARAMNLVLSEQPIGRWAIRVIRFESPVKCLAVSGSGVVANSVPTTDTGKRRLIEWKRRVADTARQSRGDTPWDSKLLYSVSVGFAFHPRAHGSQPLDIENFIKPSIDALAAGLFCRPDEDAAAIPRYNYDDSNIRYLFVQRLPDVARESEEGAAFFVSAARHP